MSILPILAARVVISALLRAGFVILRQKGSHVFLKNPLTGKVTSVPLHTKDLTRGLLTAIIKQAGLTVQQFLRLLKK